VVSVLKQKRSKNGPKTEKNPYSSASNPREYSRWYHEHHPGYFAKKTKEWLERQAKSRRSVFFAERNKRTRTYQNAYRKLYRRLWGSAKSPPSFSVKERIEIDNSPYLSEMLRKVRTQRKVGVVGGQS